MCAHVHVCWLAAVYVTIVFSRQWSSWSSGKATYPVSEVTWEPKSSISEDIVSSFVSVPVPISVLSEHALAICVTVGFLLLTC